MTGPHSPSQIPPLVAVRYIPDEPTKDADGTLSGTASAESTTLFYAAAWSFVAAAVVFSHGIPYRQPVVYNRECWSRIL